MLLLEAQGIQSIVRRSEALKGLMGHSAMVELEMEEAADVVRKRLAPESIVFIGGGSLLAVVPSGLFEEIKKEASRKYSEFVKGASVLKAPLDRDPASFSLYELKNGPGFAWSASVSYPGELSPRSFGQVFNIAMQTLEPCEVVDPVGGELRLKPSRLCTVCRMEEGLSTSPDGERLGQVCKQAYDVRGGIMETLQKPVPIGEGGEEPAGGGLRGEDPELNRLPIVSVTWRSIEKLSER